MTTDDVTEVLDLLNTALAIGSDRFCTCVLARMQPRGSSLSVDIARGGHPYPLVVRRDGSVSAVKAEGALLGVLDGPEFTRTTLDLTRGDTLVIHTDGLTEARDNDGELFGEHSRRNETRFGSWSAHRSATQCRARVRVRLPVFV